MLAPDVSRRLALVVNFADLDDREDLRVAIRRAELAGATTLAALPKWVQDTVRRVERANGL